MLEVSGCGYESADSEIVPLLPAADYSPTSPEAEREEPIEAAALVLAVAPAAAGDGYASESASSRSSVTAAACSSHDGAAEAADAATAAAAKAEAATAIALRAIEVSTTFCYDGLLFLRGSQVDDLAAKSLSLLEDVGAIDFVVDSDCGKHFAELFDRLQSHVQRRGATWTEISDRSCKLDANTKDESYLGKAVMKRHIEASELIFLCSRLFASALGKKLQRMTAPGSTHEGVCLLLAGQSDEASFRLRVFRQKEVSGQAPDAATPAVVLPVAVPVAAGGAIQRKNSVMQKSKQSETHDKVVFTDLSFAAVVRDKSSKKLTSIRGDVAMPLQHLDRATAENLVDCQETAYNIPGLADRSMESCFKHVYIAHVQDRLSANVKQYNASRADDARQGRKRRRLDIPCDIHPLSNVACKVWSMVNSYVSGFLAMAISQRGAGKLDVLRGLVGEKASSMVRIIRRLFLSLRVGTLGCQLITTAQGHGPVTATPRTTDLHYIFVNVNRWEGVSISCHSCCAICNPSIDNSRDLQSRHPERIGSTCPTIDKLHNALCIYRFLCVVSFMYMCWKSSRV